MRTAMILAFTGAARGAVIGEPREPRERARGRRSPGAALTFLLCALLLGAGQVACKKGPVLATDGGAGGEDAGPPDATAGGGDGGASGPSQGSCYALESFVRDVQPVLDSKGCTNLSCHGTRGTGGALLLSPASAGEAAVAANFRAFQVYGDLDDPAASPILLRPAGDRHLVVWQEGDDEYAAVRGYIEASAASCAGADGGAPVERCFDGRPVPDLRGVNLGAFERHVWPYVLAPTRVQVASGNCASNQCHGQGVLDRNPNGLWLRDPDTFCEIQPEHPDCPGGGAKDSRERIMAANLKQIACWIDPAQPLRSPLLVCPLGGDEGQGCPVDHATVGGGPIFTAAGAGQRDPRYQTLANLVYGMLGRLGPWEDIFWDRVLAPALAVTDLDGQGTTCASSSCHGPGTPLFFRVDAGFQPATAFFDRFDARQSMLFLFPTNLDPTDAAAEGDGDQANPTVEIDDFNLDRFGANPHDLGGGGRLLDIAAIEEGGGLAGQQLVVALMEHFLRGIGPDPADGGSMVDWLVAGAAARAQSVLDPGPLDERTLEPRWNEPGDAGNLRGAPWQELFSLDGTGARRADIDLIAFFQQPPDGGSISNQDGDVTYLATYLHNVSGLPRLEARLFVESAQPYVVYLDGSVALSADRGGNLDTLVTISPGEHRLLIKTQRADGAWQLRVFLRDRDGAASINAGGTQVLQRLRPGAAM